MKKFLIMGTVNTASYKDLYEVLLKRKLLIGYNKNKIIFKNDLNEDKGVPNIYWYTNMKHIYKDSLKLNYYKDESKIYKYDNKDYYGVDFIRHTPDNYYKEIGLPVTFLWYDNLKDYELIDIVREYYNGNGSYIREDNYKDKLPLFSAGSYEHKRDYIAYLDSHSLSIKAEACNLTIDNKFDQHGFRLRLDNYKEKLPLFQAGSYTVNNWFEKTIINKTYDGNGSYINDTEFIKRCLIHTCLSFKNKCRSLWGSNGKLYLNNLCFDTDTIASKDLLKYELNDYEKDMIEDYYKILEFIKTTEEYKEEYKYGLFQIREEINIKDDNKKLKYPNLDKMLKDIKKKIDTYYTEYIVNDLFKYELLK